MRVHRRGRVDRDAFLHRPVLGHDERDVFIHADEDVEKIVTAVKETIAEQQFIIKQLESYIHS